jgi:hypothetical protein
VSYLDINYHFACIVYIITFWKFEILINFTFILLSFHAKETNEQTSICQLIKHTVIFHMHIKLDSGSVIALTS